MRVAILSAWLGLAACAADDPEDNPDWGPTLPTEGQWEVVEHTATEDCGDGPQVNDRTKYFPGFYLLHRDGQLAVYMGVGPRPAWPEPQLCPVALNGEFGCPERVWSEEYPSSGNRYDWAATLSGRTRGGDTPMDVHYHRVTVVTGADSNGATCVVDMTAVVTLTFAHGER